MNKEYTSLRIPNEHLKFIKNLLDYFKSTNPLADVEWFKTKGETYFFKGLDLPIKYKSKIGILIYDDAISYTDSVKNVKRYKTYYFVMDKLNDFLLNFEQSEIIIDCETYNAIEAKKTATNFVKECYNKMFL